jgi:hypothetical protein
VLLATFSYTKTLLVSATALFVEVTPLLKFPERPLAMKSTLNLTMVMLSGGGGRQNE